MRRSTLPRLSSHPLTEKKMERRFFAITGAFLLSVAASRLAIGLLFNMREDLADLARAAVYATVGLICLIANWLARK